jgi:hypothetical protein
MLVALVGALASALLVGGREGAGGDVRGASVPVGATRGSPVPGARGPLEARAPADAPGAAPVVTSVAAVADRAPASADVFAGRVVDDATGARLEPGPVDVRHVASPWDGGAEQVVATAAATVVEGEVAAVELR